MQISDLFQTYVREIAPIRGFAIDGHFHGRREPALRDMLRFFLRPDGGADVFVTMVIPQGSRVLTPGGGALGFYAGDSELGPRPKPLMKPRSDVPLSSEELVTVGAHRDTLLFVGILSREGVLSPAEKWCWETAPSETPNPRLQKCLT